MKTIITLLLAWTSAARVLHYSDLLREEWNAYKLEYNKTYIHRHKEDVAMKIFAQNKYKIARHNQRYKRGLETFRMGINQFSDMTVMQYSRAMNGYRRRTRDDYIKPATYIPAANVRPLRKVNWVRAGAVTEVKDQTLNCKSCWAFAATGALEGQHFRNNSVLVSLSEQNLIDCISGVGCTGGDMLDSFAYISDNDGIDTEDSYPYEGVKKECRYNNMTSGAVDVGIVIIKQQSEDDLQMAVSTVGPVAVAVDGALDSFKSYSSGVYYDKHCSSNSLNHALLVVGYGRDRRGGAYWLAKNSFGTLWGENGYIRIARGRGNLCGIATEASFPLV